MNQGSQEAGRGWNWEREAPMMLPRWIIGPSGPTGRPAPTARVQEANLTMKVLMLKNCLIIVPLRKLISSGVPDPAAEGLMRTTKPVLNRTKRRLKAEALSQARGRCSSRRKILAKSHLKSAIASISWWRRKPVRPVVTPMMPIINHCSQASWSGWPSSQEV